MPILIVLLLTAACAKVPWPAPPFRIGASGSVGITAFLFLLPIGATAILTRWTTSALRNDSKRRAEVGTIYNRYRRYIGYANLFIAILTIVCLGWGWSVWHRTHIVYDGRELIAPFAELLVPAPYILTIFIIWLLHYDAERAFHETAIRTALHSFWTRFGHFAYNFRPFAFLVMFPVGMFCAQQTFIRYAPEWADHELTLWAGLLVVPLLFVLLPLLVRPVLGLKPMPAGPDRERLEALAKTWKFRYRDLLIWPTRDGMANALVVGVVPQARYIVFTDKLLETLAPDELDAVFGHELGHAKHWHIPYYAAFFTVSAVATAVGVGVLFHEAVDADWIDARAWEPWAGLPPLAALGAYIFIVFGFLSRRCERQADIYGCRVVSGGLPVTRDGVNAMIRALERVADMNGMDAASTRKRLPLIKRFWAMLKSWQHGTIAERIHFLTDLADNPQMELAVQRRTFLLRCGLFLGLFAAILGLGFWIGWRDFAKWM